MTIDVRLTATKGFGISKLGQIIDEHEPKIGYKCTNIILTSDQLKVLYPNPDNRVYRFRGINLEVVDGL